MATDIGEIVRAFFNARAGGIPSPEDKVPLPEKRSDAEFKIMDCLPYIPQKISVDLAQLPKINSILTYLYDYTERKDKFEGGNASGVLVDCRHINNFRGMIKQHPLILAAHIAFSEHKPLILTPDDFLLPLIQAASRNLNTHLKNDAAKMKNPPEKVKLIV